jgi:Trypsin-like serine proteases, typically periplasmic, contain C-terminal PDZ domain
MVGKFLASKSFEGKLRVGALGSDSIALSTRSKGGYFGVSLQLEDSLLVVTNVDKMSPAEKAGIPVKAHILTIDDTALSQPSDFSAIIQHHRKGDVVQVALSIEGQRVVKRIELGEKSLISPTHAAEQFEGGKSEVRDGFDFVYAYDARIQPKDCGGPVLDADNNFYGINIARLSRTTTLIMSADEIKRVVSKMKF